MVVRPSIAATGINHTINFQGKLVNSDGTNVTNGSYSIVFSLYTVSSGGSAAWTETDSVTTTDGVFRVGLGGTTTFSSASIDFNSDTYYLGIKVGSDAEMTPRVQFTAVPYAFNAEKVNGLTVTNNGGNTLNIAANKTLTANNSLGLSGTDGTTFTFPSTSDTVVTLTASQVLTNKTIGSTGLIFSGATTDITTGTNEDFDILPNGTGKIGLFTNGTLRAGLDVRAASGTLAVASVSGATSFAGLVVDNSGTGDIFTASSSGLNRFVIKQNGNIGIATTNPDTFTVQVAGAIGPDVDGTYNLGNFNHKWNYGYFNNFTAYDNAIIGSLSNPVSELDVRTDSGLYPNAAIASISGQTTFAGLVVDNSGTGDIFTASSSGLNRFVIKQNGNVGIGTTTPGASLDLSTGTIQGAGLSTDCSSANSILQWSSSTKKFTCATSGSILVQKSADQSVSSSTTGTTLVNDTDLKTSSLPTNTAVVMHFVIHFQAGTTGQYKFAVTGPAGSSLTGYARGFQAAGTGATGNGCAMVLNTSCTIPNTDTSELAIHIEVVAQTAGTGGAFNFQFAQVTSNATASITRKNSALVYWILPNAADYAEVYYTKDPTIEAADVVSVDGSLKSGVQKSKGSYDNTTVGIISTNPAYLIGDVGDNTGAPVKLALSGRVPVKVSSINGSIKAGDYLTSSAIPGVAMKATRPGQMIGKALEDYSSDDPTSVGSISVFVNLSWADPGANSFRNNTALVDHFSQELTGLDVTEESNINDVSILKNISASSSGSLSQTFTDRLVAAFGIVTTRVTADTIYAHTIKADHIEGLDLLNTQVLQLTNKIATLSANNAVLGASTSATEVTNPLTLNPSPTVGEGNIIDGLTVTKDATVSGKLRVKGSGLFEGILSVIDTLKANDFMATGIAEFFNTAIFHKDVSFEGQPTFTADTAGFAVIRKGSDHIDITFDKPYQATPVVNATLSVTSTSVTPTPINGKTLEQRLLDEGYYYIVTKQSTKGFTIVLNKQATEDVQFSWSALSIKDAKIFQSGGVSPTVPLTPTPSSFLLNPEASGSAN